MNKPVFLFAFILVVFQPILAQTLTFSRCYGGTGNDERCFSSIDYPPGVLMTGKTNSSASIFGQNHGQTDACLLATLANGNLSWAATYGGPGIDIFMKTIQTSDGNLLSVGASNMAGGQVSANHGGIDFWVVKTTLQGAILWEKTYGGPYNEWADAVIELADGSFMIAGTSYSTSGDITYHHGNFSTADLWMIRVSPVDGSLLWQRSFGGSENEGSISYFGFLPCVSMVNMNGTAFAFAATTNSSDGDVYYNTPGTNSQFWLVKCDSSGSMQFKKTYGGSGNEWARSIDVTNDGGFILTGGSLSNDGDVSGHHGSSSYSDVWVMKTDANGNLQWQYSLGGGIDDDALCVKTVPLGHYILARSESNNGDCLLAGNHGGLDYWLIYLDYNGHLQWNHDFGGSSVEEGFTVFIDSGGSLVCTGESGSTDGDVVNNNGNGGFDFWMIRMDDLSGMNTTVTQQQTAHLYPNPGAGIVNISLDASMGKTTVQLFGTQGELIFRKETTESVFQFDSKNLTPGLYNFLFTGENGETISRCWLKK